MAPCVCERDGASPSITRVGIDLCGGGYGGGRGGIESGRGDGIGVGAGGGIGAGNVRLHAAVSGRQARGGLARLAYLVRGPLPSRLAVAMARSSTAAALRIAIAAATATAAMARDGGSLVAVLAQRRR